MLDKQVTAAISYMYLRSEIKRISEENHLTEKQIQEIDNNLKVKLGIGQEFYWI